MTETHPNPPDPVPPAPADQPALVEPSVIAPQTDRTAADFGTKLFVIFFMVLVPPLGIAMVAAMVWSLWQLVIGNA